MGTDMKGYEVAYKGRVYPALEMHMIWEGSRRREEAQELRDIAEVLKITANTDGNIKRSMEAILRIADRLERGKGHDKGAGKTV